jgi:hypothetical protein
MVKAEIEKVEMKAGATRVQCPGAVVDIRVIPVFCGNKHPVHPGWPSWHPFSRPYGTYAPPNAHPQR